MRKHVTNFVEMFNEGIELSNTILQSGRFIDLYKEFEPDHVVIIGMGGSGIAGQYIKNMFSDLLNIPVTIVNEYKLPRFATRSRNTLFIAISYSGNTEETLTAIKPLFEPGLDYRVITITSGGKMKQFHDEDKADLMRLPSGLPPRAALPYTLAFLTNLFDTYINNFVTNFRFSDLISEHLKQVDLKQLETLSTDIVSKLAMTHSQKVTGQFQYNLLGLINYIIYTSSELSHVALRTKQQINENSKRNSWYSICPEFTHNEMISINTETSQNNVYLFLTKAEMHEQTRKRMNFVQSLLQPKCVCINIEQEMLDNNVKVNDMSMTILLDFMSVEIAERCGIDPVEVNIIENLKAHVS